MDHVGVLLGSMALFGITVDGLLRIVEKKARKFPYCRTCGLIMNTAGTSKFMPGEVSRYLEQYNLPAVAASRLVCPKGHYQLWFIPKFGNTEKAFFLREEL
jgi:hypothetical protein